MNLILLVFLLPLRAFAHGGHHHGVVAKPNDEKIQAINSDYLRSVKPIFVRACFDCHSNQTAFPWYHQIPGIRQYLDRDVSTGRQHLEMSGDFPFQGHGSVIEDLQAIQKDVREEDMPPWNYRLMHRKARLSDSEKQAIYDWVGRSLSKVQSH